MKLSNIVLQLIGIVLMFIFMPFENRIFLFHNSPDSYYGEFRVRCKNQDYILAKNCAEETVCLDQKVIKDIYHKDILSPYSNFSSPLSIFEIPQHSYALIFLNPSPLDQQQRRVKIDNKEYNVKDLNLITDAEANYSYVITLVIVFLVGLLVHLITEFISRNSHEFLDKAE